VREPTCRQTGLVMKIPSNGEKKQTWKNGLQIFLSLIFFLEGNYKSNSGKIFSTDFDQSGE
jgi:hypothetical protein